MNVYKTIKNVNVNLKKIIKLNIFVSIFYIVTFLILYDFFIKISKYISIQYDFKLPGYQYILLGCLFYAFSYYLIFNILFYYKKIYVVFFTIIQLILFLLIYFFINYGMLFIIFNSFLHIIIFIYLINKKLN